MGTRRIRSGRAVAGLGGLAVVAGAALATPAGATQAPQYVKPSIVMECVATNPAGAATPYTAYWGHASNNAGPIEIPVGAKNRFSPSPQGRGQRTTFAPGRHYLTFTTEHTGADLVWIVDGKTATAGRPVSAGGRSKDCVFDLSVKKRADRDVVAPGEEVTWTVEVENTGNKMVPVEQIAVTDDDADLTRIGVRRGDVLVDDAPTWLHPGEALVHRATVIATATTCGGALVNRASATLRDPSARADDSRVGWIEHAESDATNNTSSASVQVAGDACTPDVPPPDVPTIPAPPPGQGTLAVGGPEVEVAPARTSSPTPAPAERAAPGPAAATTTPAVCRRVALRTRLVAPRAHRAGSRARVRVRVRNAGRTAATAATARLVLARGFVLARKPADAAVRGRSVTLRVGDLAPGRTRTVGVLVRSARTAAGSKGFRALVSARCARRSGAASRVIVRPAQQVKARAVPVTG